MPPKNRSRRDDTNALPHHRASFAAAFRDAFAADTLPQPYLRIVIALLLCMGIALRWVNLDNVAARTPDEQVYARQANIVRSQGTAGLRGLTAEYERDSTWSTYPPPTRAGFIWLVAAVQGISGSTDEVAGAYLSAASSTSSLLLLAWLGFRFFPAWAAVFAVLFFAVSPPELTMARRAWQDCLIEFLGLALVAALAQVVRGSRRRVWYLVFVLVGSIGVLIKESWLLVYGFWALSALWLTLVGRRDWKSGLLLVAAGLAGFAAGVSWLAGQVGGFSTLLQIVSRIPSANAANAYAIEAQTGPPYLLLQAFWILAPIPALLCLPGLVVALFPRCVPERLRNSPNSALIRWIALFLPAVLVFPFVLPHWLNLRYVSALFPEVYLLAGLGFWYFASVAWSRLPVSGREVLAVLGLLLLACAAFTDYARFERRFVRLNVSDLSVKNVLITRHQ